MNKYGVIAFAAQAIQQNMHWRELTLQLHYMFKEDVATKLFGTLRAYVECMQVLQNHREDKHYLSLLDFTKEEVEERFNKNLSIIDSYIKYTLCSTWEEQSK